MKEEQEQLEEPINDTFIDPEPETSPLRILLSHLNGDYDAHLKLSIQESIYEIINYIILTPGTTGNDTILKLICDLYKSGVFSLEETEILINHISTRINTEPYIPPISPIYPPFYPNTPITPIDPIYPSIPTYPPQIIYAVPPVWTTSTTGDQDLANTPIKASK